ncbi:MAG: DNA-directed RNA polymerase subunit omega [Clostridiales bacterium]|nr:DNA-directed RNA polymerase subunit omega [Clostridiales bacterium]
MLTDPSIEKLKQKGESPYDVAVLVSKRARQLVNGAQPMVEDKGVANVVSLACREIMDEKVVAVEGDASPVVPITREERLRRQKEEEDKRKQREEELADALSMAQAAEEQPAESEDAGLDKLLDSVLGSDDEFEDAEDEEGPSDEDLEAVEEEEN